VLLEKNKKNIELIALSRVRTKKQLRKSKAKKTGQNYGYS